MRITSKGQVPIPVHVREQSGLFPGTKVKTKTKCDEVFIPSLRAQRSNPAWAVEAPCFNWPDIHSHESSLP